MYIQAEKNNSVGNIFNAKKITKLDKGIDEKCGHDAILNKYKSIAEEKDLEVEAIKLLILELSNYDGASFLAHFDDEIIGVILNGGGYTHTSIALMDAVSSISKPVIEVHFSDISKREEFRHHSYLTDVCEKTFKGNGINSYFDAIDYLISRK